MRERGAHLEVLLARERAHKALQMLGVSDSLFQQPAPLLGDKYTTFPLPAIDVTSFVGSQAPCNGMLQTVLRSHIAIEAGRHPMMQRRLRVKKHLCSKGLRS